MNPCSHEGTSPRSLRPFAWATAGRVGPVEMLNRNRKGGRLRHVAVSKPFQPRRNVRQGNGLGLAVAIVGLRRTRSRRATTAPNALRAPTHIDWYLDKRDDVRVRTFMKRPVKLPVQFERAATRSETRPVSVRRRSTSNTCWQTQSRRSADVDLRQLRRIQQVCTQYCRFMEYPLEQSANTLSGRMGNLLVR